MMPSAKMVSRRRFPPVNRSARPSAEPELGLKNCASASALMPGVGMNAPRRYTASKPSVKSTRLRSSGMRKLLANFSNIKTSSVLPEAWPSRPKFLGVNLYPSRISREDALTELLADQNCLAAGLLDGFLRGLRKLMRVDRNRASQLAVVEHLDQAALFA